jgi:hypothetical protein
MFMGHKVAMTEVNENNETEFELNMPGMTFSYRAQKISQPVCEPVANVDKYEILKGNTYTFNDEVSQTGVEIEFKELDAFMYNMMNVKKYECSAINPEFESEAPVILPGRYIFEPQLIYSHTSEVRFDLNSIPQHINSDDIRVFQRTSPDSGIFNELITEFDSQENQIKAITSEFGEFIIGFYRNPSNINPPKLMYPANNKSFTNNDTVRFVWSSTGRYDNFEIQISDDETFNNSIVLDSNNIKTPILNLSGFDSDSKYYWRTRTLYNDQTSDWSLVRNFNFTNEFMEIIYPKGPNKFAKDSTLIIRWNTNMTDSVSIKLYNNGQFVQNISEGFKSVSGAFAWRIDPDLDDDTLYSVIVTNLNNPEIQSESDKFGIGTLTSVNQELEYQNNFADFEVFPNPAADIIKLSLTLNQNEFVKLEIYDVSGNLIKTVLNTRLDEGKFTIPLNVKGLEQGIYYCVLKTDSNSKVEKIIIMR